MALPTIDATVRCIQFAHSGQSYKPGVDYWSHPVAVMKRLPPDATHEEKLAALLHDVIEDTTYTPADLLRMGYAQQVLDMVAGVTSKKPAQKMDKSETVQWYRAQIQSIVDGSKVIGENADGTVRHLADDPLVHRGAMRVKLADNQVNYAPENLEGLPQDKLNWFHQKYAGVSQMLKDGLRAWENAQSRAV